MNDLSLLPKPFTIHDSKSSISLCFFLLTIPSFMMLAETSSELWTTKKTRKENITHTIENYSKRLTAFDKLYTCTVK